MNIKRLPTILLAFIVMCAGCSYIESYLDITKGRGLSEQYNETLNASTRSKVAYSEFETIAHITATSQGAIFKKAYLDEYARIYQLPAMEKKIRENSQTNAISDTNDFFFYASIPDKESNDFGKERSIWTIYLLNGKGQRFDPIEIRKIDRITPLITVFYPYVNQYYGMCYSLKFLPQTGEKPFKLVFRSVIGMIELDWN